MESKTTLDAGGPAEEDVEAASVIAATKAAGIMERGQSQLSNSNSNSFSSLLPQACLRCPWEVQFRSYRRSNSKHRQVKAQRLPSDVNHQLQRRRSKRQEEADGCLIRRVPTCWYETPSREAPTPLLFSIHVTSTYETQAESPRVT